MDISGLLNCERPKHSSPGTVGRGRPWNNDGKSSVDWSKEQQGLTSIPPLDSTPKRFNNSVTEIRRGYSCNYKVQVLQ